MICESTGSNAPRRLSRRYSADIKKIDRDHPVSVTSFLWGGPRICSTFRALPETQDWIVGIVVPRIISGELLRTRRQVLWTSLV